MLIQLSVQNFALIDRVELSFEKGLNVLTGETGAGKSILLDALRLVLGERLAGDQKSVGDKTAKIEAVFELPAKFIAPEIVAELLEDGDECLILKREISAEGRSKCYINHQFVNLSALKSLGDSLLDFHGQYDQQNIFKEETHLELIDRIAGLSSDAGSDLIQRYREDYRSYKNILKQLKQLEDKAEGKQRQMDLLAYQIDEIEEVSPEIGEEEALLQEKIRLAHAQKLYELSDAALNDLDEDENSASSQIQASFRHFSQWVRIDESAQKLEGEIEDIQLRLEELIRDVRDYRDELSFDDEKLNELENRISALERLKKKYGPELKDVIAFLEKSKAEYDVLLNTDVYKKDLEKELQAVLPGLKKKAEEISKKRKKAAALLQKQVETELKDLSINQARFECELEQGDFNDRGVERARFLFCPNPGQPMSPLVKVASGGEASRVLLALKRALTDVDETPTLVFDEIDANIGGRLGEVVGRKLIEIGAERQILLITHLPQIASFANRHYKVSKSVQSGRTKVEYSLLEGEARIDELAQMMSGARESQISREHAEEMIKSASK